MLGLMTNTILHDFGTDLHFISLDQAEGSSNSAPGATSTWSNVLSKVKLMLPYIWPKGSVLLQLTVVACLIILGIGRVLNVFVPLYSKYIGESATLGPVVVVFHLVEF